MDKFRNWKILYIEDNEELLNIAKMYFKKNIKSIDLLTSKTGNKGIDQAFDEIPDIILLDIGLPDINGINVLKKLKNSKEFANTPIIIITGASKNELKINALNEGAIDYINKPFNFDELGARLKIHLKQLKYINKIKKQNKILKENQESGKKIQMSLLPKQNLTIKNFNFKHILYPSAYLSGDFVDYFEIDKDKLGFYISDISGHGLASSFITVFLKSFMEQKLESYNLNQNQDLLDPAVLMKKLNTEIIKENIDKYLTLFYGVLNLNNNTLNFCNAGHFPQPLLISNTEANFIKTNGVPIGLFDGADFKTSSIKLKNYFNLYVFSDGLLEILKYKTLNDKKNFLKQFLIKNNKNSIKKLNDHLKLNNLKNLPDDITLLSVRKES